MVIEGLEQEVLMPGDTTTEVESREEMIGGGEVLVTETKTIGALQM